MHEATLYVVATPIGNLRDISERAIEVLGRVDVIAAEDTRHSGQLLHKLGVSKPMFSYHEHNEQGRGRQLVEKLQAGQSIALISDAGTPLISDPGYQLVRTCRLRGIPVVSVPGPSALIAALSVSGLPTDRFSFEGFLPRTPGKRRALLERLVDDSRTLVFYESSHRIPHALEDLRQIFGGDREAAIARELTKRFETLLAGTLDALHAGVSQDVNQQKGEFVLMVAGRRDDDASMPDLGRVEARRLMRVLLDELPAGKAAAIAAELLGGRKKAYYRLALELKGDAGDRA